MVPVWRVIPIRSGKLDVFWRAMSLVVFMAVVTALSIADAAAAPGANCTISTTPNPPVITAGGDVLFSA